MRQRLATAREYLEAILVAVIFLAFANTFVVKTFYIPSGSMEDTLLIGDHLFVNRFIFRPAATALERSLLPLRPIRRGDIVIFRSVEDPALDLVKRCVGLPGDVIEIRDKRLHINGQRLEEPYVKHDDERLYSNQPGVQLAFRRRDNLPPFTVPAGHYFCMGDNRDRSYDSRSWGAVPAHYVKGRALVIYWSFDYGDEVPDGRWSGMGAKVGQLFRTALGFATRTRWARTLHLIR